MDEELQKLLIQWNAEKIKALVVSIEYQKTTTLLAQLNVAIYKRCQELKVDINLLNL
jgi:hypothetical protein